MACVHFAAGPPLDLQRLPTVQLPESYFAAGSRSRHICSRMQAQQPYIFGSHSMKVSEPSILNQMLPPRLLLLDSMALIYRAHYALINSPRYTSGRVCTSAVFGIANTLLDLTRKEPPTYIGAAMDTPEPTFRHQEFPAYKATREEMPEDLSLQIPLVMRLFEAFRIPILRMPGFEADDIMGTLATRAEAAGFDTWLVTPDKDMQQLVSDRIQVYKPGRQGGQFELMAFRDVQERWQVNSSKQIIDILGLMGDASDNIPGVPGIGEKTAQKLIAEYGSIEHLLANTGQLKGKQREKIEEFAEQARLSKRLATIPVDIPIEATWDELRFRDYDSKALQQLFIELEFETQGKRLFGPTFSVASARQATARQQREVQIQKTLFDDATPEETSISNVNHEYIAVVSAAERQALVQQLSACTSFCFDTETTGLDPRTAAPVGIAFCFKPQFAYFVPCPEDPSAALQILEEFRAVFEDSRIEKIGHNLKFDMTLLRWHGIHVRGPLFDTMLAHSMKEPEMSHGLDYLSKLYLGYTPIPITALIGEKGPHQKSMRDVPLREVVEYAGEDADVTWRIAQILRQELPQQNAEQVCIDVEFPLIPVLIDMEFEGIRLDVDAIRHCSASLDAEIAALSARILEAAGQPLNIDSPKQLGIVLYETLKLDDRPKKTATGQYSTREADLQRLLGKHPIVQDILDYRNAVKLKSVYIEQLPAAVNPVTGRVHTHYSQTWTATGRMQSNDPNLQTIPVRKERGREIRAAFARSTEYQILSADYSQIELRIMAELSEDSGMMEAFQSGLDIHTVTASKVYKIPVSDVTREMRNKAKTVNFGILYGISSFGLQQRLNIPRQEARDLIDNYFEKYPGIREYIDRTIVFAREHGFVQTRTGRRRYLRDIDSQNNTRRAAAERLAMNSPIQGTAADMLKLAMIKIDRMLRDHQFRTRMLLTVHDEIVFDLFRAEQELVVPQIVECMRSALPMRVPIEVEVGIGDNWLEAHG